MAQGAGSQGGPHSSKAGSVPPSPAREQSRPGAAESPDLRAVLWKQSRAVRSPPAGWGYGQAWWSTAPGLLGRVEARLGWQPVGLGPGWDLEKGTRVRCSPGASRQGLGGGTGLGMSKAARPLAWVWLWTIKGCSWSWSSAGQTLGPQLEAAARDRGSAPATSSCSVVPVSPEGREQPPAALSVSCQSPGSRTPSSGEGTCRALHHHPPHVRCPIVICSCPGESLCSVLQLTGVNPSVFRGQFIPSVFSPDVKWWFD